MADKNSLALHQLDNPRKLVSAVTKSPVEHRPSNFIRSALVAGLFIAELVLYDKPEDRARALQRQLDVYHDAEGKLKKQVKERLAKDFFLARR